MKVIDLLNRIANNEEVPTRIRYRNEIYKAEYNKYFEKNYYEAEDENINVLLLNEISSVSQLNDEVEVIEEDKKIKKYNTGLDNGNWNEESVRKTILEDKNIEDFLVRLMKETDAIKFKLYEIIDKINKD